VRRIAIVAFDGCQALDVIGPHEVFAGAREVQVRTGAKDRGYEPVIVGVGKEITSDSGVRMTPMVRIEGWPRRTPIDTLIVAGGAGARKAALDANVVRNVKRLAARAKRVASVCTGAFVLAAAGLLDGKRATTHWAWCDKLQSEYPEVQVERDPIYVRDGNVWTSAGVTAGIDLSLAIVEADLGREVATTLARWLVVFVRRSGGQQQFSAQLAAQTAEREPVRDLQAWIVEHPDEDLEVPALARRAGMSGRNFSRVFRAEVGVPPAAYVERVRLETARRLLESTARSVDDVAIASGFGTPESLRRAFGRRVGLSPREYRARFGAQQGAQR
jgi:transcriptional regulator GlxA family with amidase domain